MKCEFCEEFGCSSTSRFSRVYGRPSRIVSSRAGFVALPTMGQLFPNSLLVLPRRHVETLAGLDAAEVNELSKFARHLEARLGSNAHVILFEHGARKESDGGCGIYHAHLHMVPVPAKTQIDALFPKSTCANTTAASSLSEALGTLGEAVEYMMVRDSENLWRYADVSGRSPFPSQFMRKRIVDLFDLQVPWDWRVYAEPEQGLISTLAEFGVVG